MVHTGDEVEIVGIRPTQKTTCTGVEMFRKLLDQGQAGDNIGALLRGTKKEEVERGQVLCKPGSITPHTDFEGQVYVLTKDEGGRHKPFFANYRPQFFFRTTDITGHVELPEGTEMCMPGDNTVDDRRRSSTPSPWTRACGSPSARAAAPSAPAASPRSSSRSCAPPSDHGSLTSEKQWLKQKIRIRLKAFDHEVIDQSTKKIVETVTRTQATVRGPIPLPTEKHRYTVIRGPHNDKDCREHFEMRIHKRLLDILEPTPKTDRLAAAHRAAGRRRHRDQDPAGLRPTHRRDSQPKADPLRVRPSASSAGRLAGVTGWLRPAPCRPPSLRPASAGGRVGVALAVDEPGLGGERAGADGCHDAATHGIPSPSTTTTTTATAGGSADHDRVRRRHDTSRAAAADAGSTATRPPRGGPFAEVLRGARPRDRQPRDGHRHRGRAAGQALRVPRAAVDDAIGPLRARRLRRRQHGQQPRHGLRPRRACRRRLAARRPARRVRHRHRGRRGGRRAFPTEVGGQRVAVIAATQVLDRRPHRRLDRHRRPTAGWRRPSGSDRLVAEVRRAHGRPATRWWCSCTGAPRGRTCPNGEPAVARPTAGRRPAPTSSSAGTPTGSWAAVALGGALRRTTASGTSSSTASSDEAAATGVLEGHDHRSPTCRATEWIPGRITGGVPAPLTGAGRRSRGARRVGRPTGLHRPHRLRPASGQVMGSRKACGAAAEGLQGHAELAVVPGAGALGADADGHPLVEHDLDERLDLLGVRAVVALPDARRRPPTERRGRPRSRAVPSSSTPRSWS